MQKLDFVNNLKFIGEKLLSNEIVQHFESGFATPGDHGRYDLIKPLLFTSKSNYDQIKSDSKYSQILISLSAATIYDEKNLATLTQVLRQTIANDIIVQKSAVALYNFHKSVLLTIKLSEDVLLTSVTEKTVEENLNEGIVIFQIVIPGDGLDTETYIKIFSALQVLVETISKIHNTEDKRHEIVLLDSGSDTNVGIKTSIENAKSLFLIFKEVWDYVTNFRFYQQKQKNNELLESLSIRAEIKKKVEEGVISEQEGLEYTYMIKTRTDELIGLKTLPKAIVLDGQNIENKKLLEQFENVKLLGSGDGEEKSSA